VTQDGTWVDESDWESAEFAEPLENEAAGPPPVVAVVGRPNVGKSTLVNRILGRREAVVQDVPGVTRDRVSYDALWTGRRFTVQDTGGWEPDAKGLQQLVAEQAAVAMRTADAVILGVAYEKMSQELAAAWSARSPKLPFDSPTQALTLASMVEKEAQLKSERTRIAALLTTISAEIPVLLVEHDIDRVFQIADHVTADAPFGHAVAIQKNPQMPIATVAASADSNAIPGSVCIGLGPICAAAARMSALGVCAGSAR